MRHLLEIDDLSTQEIEAVLALSAAASPPQVLAGKGAALLFEKPSARTRNSMEMAVAQLGGHPVYIRPEEVGLDVRETVEDVTRTMACFHGVLAARVFAHATVERMAAVDVVPVINMLSDQAHPLQALADLLTIKQEFGGFDGVSVAYVGDSNNVTRSLALGAARVGVEVRVASPAGFGFSETDADRLALAGCELITTDRPAEACEGVDVVYTDVWTSMGQEEETAQRLKAFEGFTVDDDLMAATSDRSIFLHCLPAHRGEEVSASVMDSAHQRIWKQAENRMHAARGLMAWLLGPAGSPQMMST